MPFGWKSLQCVLCLGAHADDIEIGCGGTILSLLAAQPELHVTWVVLSGDERRAVEASRSCLAYAGGSDRIELIQQSFPDSYFPQSTQEIKAVFQQLASRAQPDLIFTHHRHDRHQDHRTVAELSWNAFRGRTILEYEIPKWEGDLGQPNLFVPLTKEIVERKASDLVEHFPTQATKPWFDRETFVGLARLRGLEANSPTRFAEAFHASKLVVDFQR
jgi:LmbE family N-acetylglucosaminyl deacetylase